MSSRYINNGSYAAAGYTLSGVFQSITIGPAGTIGTFGIIASGTETYTIVNRGQITGAAHAISLDGGTLVNAGTISGTLVALGAYGVAISGGAVTNSVGGLIEGYGGVDVSGAMTNAGTIEATGTETSQFGQGSGVNMASACALNNSGTGALIEGYFGVFGASKTGTVINSGTIMGTIGTASVGVALGNSNSTLAYSGTITNTGLILGRADGVTVFGTGVITNSIGGVIEGERGIYFGGGSLTNAGTIIGTDRGGIDILYGTITNNAGGMIGGAYGVQCYNGVINNQGIISESVLIGFSGFGIEISAGRVDNARSTSLVQGYLGIEGGFGQLGGPAGTVTIDNAGTIIATGTSTREAGISLYGPSFVSNAAGGIIKGAVGVTLVGMGTLTNFGTIASTAGTTGVAVRLISVNDMLIDEAGSVFIGMIVGGGGTLELAGSVGTLTNLGTSFSGFGIVDVLAGASFTLTGTEILASGTTSSLVDNGLLTLGGTASASGTISGTGTLVLAGLESFIVGTALTVADLTQSAGTATLRASLTYAGKFAESGGTLSLGNKVLTLTGAAGFTGGTISGTGHLSTEAATTVSTLSFAGGAGWANYGTVTQSRSLTLGGTGTGGSRLSNESGAVFDVTGTGGIAIASGGSGNIVNGGLIEKTGTGTSTIAAAIANNGGTIAVTAGTLDLAGAVTYTGKETIGKSGTLKFDGAVGIGQTISFAGPNGGELVLNDPSSSALGFAGKISGFGGSDQLDLASFAYVTGSKPGWVQNGSSGTLTVTEGSKTAKITLFGQYAAAGFSATKDAAGDTLITYTKPAQMVALASPHP